MHMANVYIYHDVCLQQCDADLIASDRAWYNDQVLSFAYEYLARDLFASAADSVCFMQPSTAFFVDMFADEAEVSASLQPLRLSQKQLIAIPVNNNDDPLVAHGGSHWSLLIFDRTTCQFRHYDSYGGFNERVAKRLAQKMGKHISLSTTASFTSAHCDQQKNAYDCGLHVINNTIHVVAQFLHMSCPRLFSRPELLARFQEVVSVANSSAT